jgi:hypothetical protein
VGETKYTHHFLILIRFLRSPEYSARFYFGIKAQNEKRETKHKHLQTSIHRKNKLQSIEDQTLLLLLLEAILKHYSITAQALPRLHNKQDDVFCNSWRSSCNKIAARSSSVFLTSILPSAAAPLIRSSGEKHSATDLHQLLKRLVIC